MKWILILLFLSNKSFASKYSMKRFEQEQALKSKQIAAKRKKQKDYVIKKYFMHDMEHKQ